MPSNLYLVGTMNTADRGIALLDTALRRRFDFIEKMPDLRHVDTNMEGVDGRAMLKAMNERITVRLDREHQIGHTYLIGVKTLDDLAEAFQRRIMPLLQEYFYDDWSKIRSVLGGNPFIYEVPDYEPRGRSGSCRARSASAQRRQVATSGQLPAYLRSRTSRLRLACSLFREHDRLRDLGKEDETELKQFALENQTDRQGQIPPGALGEERTALRGELRWRESNPEAAPCWRFCRRWISWTTTTSRVRGRCS